VIIPIEALINEKTVVQHQLPTVDYWHIELDAHDIVFAEGLPSESYLDTGNRSAFANSGEFVELHPDFAPRHWSDTCVPLRKEGEEVQRTKAKLLARVEALGYAINHEHDLHILADGRRIEPLTLGDTRFAFVLPAGCQDLQLVSRSFVPAHMIAGGVDRRRLGVCVKRLQIDGEDLPLDHESLQEGWSGLERTPNHPDHRWTTGYAPLTIASRLVIVDLASPGFYWVEPENNVARLYA
jgi:hypothetical protein